MNTNKIDFKKLQKAVQQYNAHLTGKELHSCNVSSFQQQVLLPTAHTLKRTGAASQKVELRALALGIIAVLGLIDVDLPRK